jgi:hypothetical protein
VRALSVQEVLSVWEWGQDRHPLDRALGFLALACPDASWEELAHLSIGQRDARLLALRELTVGLWLHGFAVCPRCGERLEFAPKTADLRLAESQPGLEAEHYLETEGFEMRFRLPNSVDLAAAARCEDPVDAQRALLRRCVLEIRQGGEPEEVDSLPEGVIATLVARMEALDPQAELRFDLTCPECGHPWSELLDIASFFWDEISALAKRLLREVHTLAQAYGWREADILDMSAVRRSLYMEMVAR